MTDNMQARKVHLLVLAVLTVVWIMGLVQIPVIAGAGSGGATTTTGGGGGETTGGGAGGTNPSFPLLLSQITPEPDILPLIALGSSLTGCTLAARLLFAKFRKVKRG